MENLFYLKICFIILINTTKITDTHCIEKNPTLRIDQGALFGKKSSDYWNGTYYSFEGIPYAKSPIGALRFKAPEPAESWKGIYDATQVRPICPQIGSSFEPPPTFEQSEDCLFLNVYSKMSKKLKPVMVWIHGGGFQYGNILEARYGPELLMSEDIVLVKVAYRLNVFGFLRLEDPKYGIHGNAGLKDVLLALKWVQNNIHHFGGNPNQVTIFGNSAGGSSVNFLYLLPLAKGLFHRAIAQSGSAGNSWLTSPKKYPEFAEALNCTSPNLDESFNCVNRTTTTNLIKGYNKLQNTIQINPILQTEEILPFNIVSIETENNTNSYLVENPETLAKSGNFNNVPIIMGFNTHEGQKLVNVYPLRPNFTEYRSLIPVDIEIDLASEDAVKLGRRIKELYYGNQTPSYDLLDPYINYLSDSMFLEKIYKFAKLQSTAAKNTPAYFYEFNYYTKLNLKPDTTKKYVTHGDEIGYLFYKEGLTPKNMDPNSDEFIAIHRMIKLWTSFATSTNANPNPINDPLLNVKWLPVEPNKFNYLKISQNLELKQNPIDDRMKFWEEVYQQYNSR